MALLKIEDFDPDHRNTFGSEEVIGSDVYTEGTQEKIGTVDDILVDEDTGEFRYFLVALGMGTISKKVLLPVGRSQMRPNVARVYARLTKEQAYNLPELEPETTVDYDYEERVRGVYRPTATVSSVSSTAPLEASASLDTAYSASVTGATPAPVSQPTYSRDTYTHKQEPSLYEMNSTDHETLKLYEERVIANKRRIKSGEVAIGKHVETETAHVSVPVEKERVVIERVTPPDAGIPVSLGAVDFREGEVTHVEIYEETPEIRKEAVVREEVRVKKVVEQETVEAQATVRHEELDVDTKGLPVVDASDSTTRKPKF